MVNDVSGLAHDPDMRSTLARADAPAIVLHMRGTPVDMTTRTDYHDVVHDVLRELSQRLDQARAAGVRQLVADPGFGFAKTAEQSLALLAHFDAFHALRVPLLSGPSRKSFLRPFSIEHHHGVSLPPDAARRDASVAAAALSAFLGAAIVRVHDVAACRGAVALADAARRARVAR
jgi:dihydropteroate synthase